MKKDERPLLEISEWDWNCPKCKETNFTNQSEVDWTDGVPHVKCEYCKKDFSGRVNF
jgi:transcription elongation factor Elf1